MEQIEDGQYQCDMCKKPVPISEVGYLGPQDRTDTRCDGMQEFICLCMDCEHKATQRSAQLRLLFSGLAAGDSIGATTEFKHRNLIPAIYEKYKDKGWPFKAVGGGAFNWEAGEPTDDTEMAMCIIRSYLDLGHFDAEGVGGHFVAWVWDGPRDIGTTTARTLARLAEGAQWHNSGQDFFLDNPLTSGNGALMRNGIIPGIATTLDDAFEFSLKQGIITHYHPLSVLCCALQTWIIWQDLCLPPQGVHILNSMWYPTFKACWEGWLTNAVKDDPQIKQWYASVTVGTDSIASAFSLLRVLKQDFNPLTTEERLGGYVLTTLRVALWALRWVHRIADTTAEGLPEEVSKKRGAYCIGWPAMVGGDTDTYGAVAGPMIAALCGEVPDSMTENLKAVEWFDARTSEGSV